MDGWTDGPVLNPYFIRVVGGCPGISSDGCMKESGKGNRREEVLERVMKYRLRKQMRHPLGDAPKQQRKEGGKQPAEQN
jgi:hypothetical protein